MKYPIGIQDFESIIKDGYVYVDKTALVYRLVTEGKIYFLKTLQKMMALAIITLFAASATSTAFTRLTASASSAARARIARIAITAL